MTILPHLTVLIWPDPILPRPFLAIEKIYFVKYQVRYRTVVNHSILKFFLLFLKVLVILDEYRSKDSDLEPGPRGKLITDSPDPDPQCTCGINGTVRTVFSAPNFLFSCRFLVFLVHLDVPYYSSTLVDQRWTGSIGLATVNLSTTLRYHIFM